MVNFIRKISIRIVFFTILCTGFGIINASDIQQDAIWLVNREEIKELWLFLRSEKQDFVYDELLGIKRPGLEVSESMDKIVERLREQKLTASICAEKIKNGGDEALKNGEEHKFWLDGALRCPFSMKPLLSLDPKNIEYLVKYGFIHPLIARNTIIEPVPLTEDEKERRRAMNMPENEIIPEEVKNRLLKQKALEAIYAHAELLSYIEICGSKKKLSLTNLTVDLQRWIMKNEGNKALFINFIRRCLDFGNQEIVSEDLEDMLETLSIPDVRFLIEGILFFDMNNPTLPEEPDIEENMTPFQKMVEKQKRSWQRQKLVPQNSFELISIRLVEKYSISPKELAKILKDSYDVDIRVVLPMYDQCAAEVFLSSDHKTLCEKLVALHGLLEQIMGQYEFHTSNSLKQAVPLMKNWELDVAEIERVIHDYEQENSNSLQENNVVPASRFKLSDWMPSRKQLIGVGGSLCALVFYGAFFAHIIKKVREAEELQRRIPTNLPPTGFLPGAGDSVSKGWFIGDKQPFGTQKPLFLFNSPSIIS